MSETEAKRCECEALRWKRGALMLLDRLCAAQCLIASPGSSTLLGMLQQATKSFERDYPPDDEAGWDMTKAECSCFGGISGDEEPENVS